MFLKRAIAIHGDRYDYSLVEYINSHTPIRIICKKHGEFLQRPHAHTNLKQGCPKCGYEDRKVARKTTEQFVNEAREKWGDRYDYSVTEYVTKEVKVKYICEKHGVVEQKPFLHLKSGCPHCNGRGINRHSLCSFVALAKKVHGDRYDYSKCEYKSMADMVEIVCKDHGSFTQKAGNHIHLKNGCPQCVYETYSSRGEIEVYDYIRSIYKGEIVRNDRSFKKELDIYLPQANLAVEYHGLYFHNELVKGKKYHFDKWSRCHKYKLRLLQFYCVEWRDKRPIIESMIAGILGNSERIAARKTQVVRIDDLDVKDEFLTKNHLQGADSSKICFGLKHDDDVRQVPVQ